MPSISALPATAHVPGGVHPSGARSGAQVASTETHEGPGKSGHSTAAEARRILAVQSAGDGVDRQPFGRTVSQVAHGLLSLANVLAAQTVVDESGEAPADTGDGATAGADAAGGTETTAGTDDPEGGETATIEAPVVTADADAALADALVDLVSDASDETEES